MATLNGLPKPAIDMMAYIMNRYIADVVGLAPTGVMWFVGTLSVATLIISVWLYAEQAYPIGITK